MEREHEVTYSRTEKIKEVETKPEPKSRKGQEKKESE